MSRMMLLVVMCAACNSGTGQGGSGGNGSSGGTSSILDKVKSVGNKVGGALDKLDVDEAKTQLGSARESLAKGLEAVEECAWVARIAEDAAKDAMAMPVSELRKLCAFDAPLSRATTAVTKAEAAKAEQPEAPSFTECSSDDWSKVKKQLDTRYASEPRWTELKTRWTKVCP